MKGQVKVEFILSIVAFAVVVFFIAMQISSTFNMVAGDSRLDALKARAVGVLVELAEDQGSPPDWYLSRPVRIGLANVSYGLSAAKVAALKSNCSLLGPMDLGSYRLVIRNSTSEVLRCGAAGGPAVTASASRPVWTGNDWGTMTLELW